MKQQKDSIFFQSSLYVAQLCEPLSLIEFCDDDKKIENEVIKSLPQSEKLAKLESPKEFYNRIPQQQKKDPYGSIWAQDVLAKQFGVQLSQEIPQNNGKWIIKKVQPIEYTQNSQVSDPKVAKDFKSQEKLFRQTASDSHRKKINRVIKQYQQSFHAQIPYQNHQVQSNNQQKLPHL